MWEKQQRLGRRKMVKVTEFKHHPVQFTKGIYSAGGEVAGFIACEVLSGVLASGSLTTGIKTISLNALCVTAGITIPAYAIAAVLDVSVNDDTSGSLSLGYKGIVDATYFPGYLQKVTVQAASNIVNSRTMIVPLGESKIVDLLAVASGSGTLDYVIKLLGWVIGGAGVTLPAHPQVNLKAKFVVSH